MARPYRRALATAAVLLACAAPAVARDYPTLHVLNLTQRVDRTTVAVNDVFHVIIRVKVSQRIDRLDSLILGSFDNCEIISNENVRTPAPDGTNFIERLTVQALAPGEATITPAYIDASDPLFGHPMRYSSNAIRVHVTSATPVDRALADLAPTARRTLGIAAMFGAFIVLVVLLARRRARRPPAPLRTFVAPPPPAPAPVAPPSLDERLLRATDAYRHTREEARVAEIRDILFELAGVGRGATLVDALRSLGEDRRAVRVALLAAERAIFGPASERQTAGDDLIAAVEAYSGRSLANIDAWTR